MINAKLTAAVACSIAISGCVAPYSSAPTAKNFPTSSQQKLQAASHWDVISKDLTRKIQANMGSKVSKNQAIYVSSKSSSPFHQAVVGEIISGLVADGFVVSKSPTNAVNMLVDTQVLEFNNGRSQAKTSGVASALATGVWALSEISATPAGIVTGLIFAGDALSYTNAENAGGGTPKTEIIINVAVENTSQYLAVTRSIYYVADSDAELYRGVNAYAQTYDFAVKGGN